MARERSYTKRTPGKKHLPLEVKYDAWYVLEDPTQLEESCWIFDPSSLKAGQVMSTRSLAEVGANQWTADILWVGESGVKTMSVADLNGFWWADPVMQKY